MRETFLDGKIELFSGDCLAVLPTLAENSIDSCVTDPPYHLTSIVKRFGGENAPPVQWGKVGDGRNSRANYWRLSKGFMGKQWDGGDIAFRPDVWREVYRVLKPGAHLLAFGGTRTYHRMACAIEDAGFEIRDTILYLYGSGFPKSHNAGNGWGTALKPACEPIVLARKPLSESTVAANVLKWGTGAINVDGCRVETNEDMSRDNGGTEVLSWGGTYGAGQNVAALRKTQGLVPLGRWPANLIHDGSEEVLKGFPESDGQIGGVNDPNGSFGYHGGAKGLSVPGIKDSGSAARFFYTAKADSDDRLGSKHPTVKPLDLMQYLVRLVTPKGGVTLDPFAGTGTTGEAAFREGMRAVLVEREAEYQQDIERRMALILAGPDERANAAIKQRMKDKPRDDGPLFAT